MGLAEFLALIHERFQIEVSLGGLTNPSVEELAGLLNSRQHLAGARVETEPDLAKDVVLDPRWKVRSLAPAGTPSRHVLLTGATGFLGTFLLSEVLRRTDAEVTCLIRAPHQKAAEARLGARLRRYGHEVVGEPRVHIVTGDLAEPRLGVGDRQYSALAREVDNVVHCGARVNFVYDYDSLKPVNVDSVSRMLDLATSGQPKSVHFISTLGMLMSTDRPRGVPVLEDGPPDCERGLPNGYEQSKWVADGIMKAAIESGLPATICRPSMLLGEMQTGRLAKTNEFVARITKGCIQLGCWPAVDTVVQLLPIDYVAPLIVEITKRPASLGHVFHLAHEKPIHMLRVVEVLRRAGYRLEPVSFGEWKKRLMRLGPRVQENALFPFLGFIHHLEEWHLSMPDVDGTNAKRVSAECGLIVDPMESLIERLVAYLESTGFLAGP